MRHLVESAEWKNAKLLVKNRCQYKPAKTTASRSLRLSDFCSLAFKMYQSSKERINVIIGLQKSMDFDNLAQVLVK